jgi:hypothetical protein
MAVKKSNIRVHVTLTRKDNEKLKKQAEKFGFSASKLAQIYILECLKKDTGE